MSATSATHDPGGTNAPREGPDQPEARRFRFVVRSRSDRVLTGTAAGLAEALGLDPLLVRLGLAVLTAAAGVGLVATGPDECGAGGPHRDRPGQGVAEPETDVAEDEHGARHDAGDGGDLKVPRAGPGRRGRGRGVRLDAQ